MEKEMVRITTQSSLLLGLWPLRRPPSIRAGWFYFIWLHFTPEGRTPGFTCFTGLGLLLCFWATSLVECWQGQIFLAPTVHESRFVRTVFQLGEELDTYHSDFHAASQFRGTLRCCPNSCFSSFFQILFCT